MFGVNPSLMALMLKGKLDEILTTGKAPEGMKIKSDSKLRSPHQYDAKAERFIILVPAEPPALDGIALNNVTVSITYKGTEFILSDQ